MNRLLKNTLSVSVNAYDKGLYGDASVTLTPTTATKLENSAFEVPYDANSGKFVASDIAAGTYLVQASSGDYEPQEREVTVNSGDQEEAFVLGRKGMSYLYRGKLRMPFIPQPTQLGVALKSANGERGNYDFIAAFAKKHGLTVQESHENYRRNNLFLLGLPTNMTDDTRAELQRELKGNELVSQAGPLLLVSEKNASMLTSNLIVRFKDQIVPQEVAAIGREHGLSIVRTIPYAGNAYMLSLNEPVSYKLLDICESLVRSGKVEYAEPDLWHTIEQDSITPTDWLHPEQWDHPHLNLPNAWQVLHDLNAAHTFGDPNVIIALFDTGIDAGHMSFTGTLSDGSTKLYHVFDFNNMVANNNAAIGNSFDGHGTCTAGAATAKANDSSSVAGTNEGTCGVAGNCKLIGIASGSTESSFSDAYIWTAGFDPHSTTAGFPAVINPGADIISNSFGFSVGMAISGLMKDTFDYLTTYGRDGKGVLLFFSTGNFIPKIDFASTNTRPWAAYKKNSAIGATSIYPTGVTERATDYSNFGAAMEFCALSHDNYVNNEIVHNPPTHRGALATARRTTGNLPGRPTRTTTLSANANAGVTTFSVASTTGMSAGQAVLINNPGAAGTEGKTISSVNSATSITVVSNDIDGNPVAGSDVLFNAHASGQTVTSSTADYTNCMGGTSYATPVCAGVAALVLSVNPDLGWTTVRQIIRNTCVKVDPNNTDATGRWKDTMGRISTDPGYTGAYFSQWYGYGRVDAEAAVTAARDLGAVSDILIRDNMSDTGAVPSSGAFWNSPDIWVRNASPASEGAAALPASYASAPPHEDAIRGQTNWVYVRLKNIGTAASNNCYVRVYIAHWPGTEFVYPHDFIPTNNPGAPIPSPMRPGTYLIGESMISSLNTGPETIINVQWDAAKIPPETVTVGGTTTHWHPCLLVQVSPFDAPFPSGNHVWDNHNLGQKNITIVNMSDARLSDTSVAFVIGNNYNSSRILELEIDRGALPDSVGLYLQILNNKAMKWLIDQQASGGGTGGQGTGGQGTGTGGQGSGTGEERVCCELEVLTDTKAMLVCCGGKKKIGFSLSKYSVIQLCGGEKNEGSEKGSYTIGDYNGRKLILLGNEQKVRVPVLRQQAPLIPVILSCVAGANVPAGSYDITINQYDPGEIISGSYGVTLVF